MKHVNVISGNRLQPVKAESLLVKEAQLGVLRDAIDVAAALRALWVSLAFSPFAWAEALAGVKGQ